ncbi:hypothetical protein J6590_022622 [Homalodisca vitripennis]|nr:hypothetical protein J6590_022622 [Homalodisca vitripennis]
MVLTVPPSALRDNARMTRPTGPGPGPGLTVRGVGNRVQSSEVMGSWSREAGIRGRTTQFTQLQHVESLDGLFNSPNSNTSNPWVDHQFTQVHHEESVGTCFTQLQHVVNLPKSIMRNPSRPRSSAAARHFDQWGCPPKMATTLALSLARTLTHDTRQIYSRSGPIIVAAQTIIQSRAVVAGGGGSEEGKR